MRRILLLVLMFFVVFLLRVAHAQQGKTSPLRSDFDFSVSFNAELVVVGMDRGTYHGETAAGDKWQDEDEDEDEDENDNDDEEEA